ncbi:hypothetical protein DERP_013228 [Dermatophagoides pteronyssinus]|uniref:Uncharacterized protein n=1 Tax=Dermatophagoides pteronyssinus TaxID=6956 RepID=A0ABQ8IRH2_DERPT|nr:hypothetical protein DERP_013228 [Dermatophagoides pteronyssinus]
MEKSTKLLATMLMEKEFFSTKLIDQNDDQMNNLIMMNPETKESFSITMQQPQSHITYQKQT